MEYLAMRKPDKILKKFFRVPERLRVLLAINIKHYKL